MSQVKIQGDPSGTGIFTIASPNSNTNYTFTLPIQTGTVLTNAGPFTANASASNGAVTIDASNNVGIGTSSPQRKLDVTVSDTTTAQVYLRNNNASYASGLIVYNAGGEASMFRHNGGSDTSYAGANSVNIGSITNNVVGFIQNNTERARINSSGNFLVGTTSTFDVTSGATTQLSGQCAVYNNGSPNTLMSFYNSSQSARVGFIGSSGNSTSYNSGSDYRLKDNVINMSGALSKLSTLRPVTFTWKVSPEVGTVSGFIAHELDEVFPEAVTGEKDAMCSDGVTPNYQMVDLSKLVPLLTAAIQEQQALITSLTARITALEAK